MHSLLATLAALLAIAAPTAGGAEGGAQPTDSTGAGALSGKTILIDPGHNGGNAAHPEVIDKLVPAGGFKKPCDTTGTATNDGRLSEPAFTWDVARRLRKLLEAQGAKVVLTRKDNKGVGPCVNRRAAIGNRAEAAAAVSIHADGAPPKGHGFHVIRPGLVRGYTGPIVDPSKQLALDTRDALDAAGLKRSNYLGKRGIDVRKDLGGLNLSKVPKVFVEFGNMRNAGDARDLKSRAWRQKSAQALSDALARYVGR